MHLRRHEDNSLSADEAQDQKRLKSNLRKHSPRLLCNYIGFVPIRNDCTQRIFATKEAKMSYALNRHTIRAVHILLSALVIVLDVSTVTAQLAVAPAPFEFEGSIRSITQINDTEYLVRCGPIDVTVRAGRTEISSPTRSLTLAQLADTTPFIFSGFNPVTGRPRQGFIGGSCIAAGDVSSLPGSYLADTLHVEISENVFVGTVTGVTPLQMNGRRVVPLTDPRMSILKLAKGFYRADGTHPGTLTAPVAVVDSVTTDNHQFGIDSNSVAIGALGAAWGYFGTNDVLYAFEIGISSGTLTRVQSRPSITRAQCVLRGGGGDELEVRGACVMPLGTQQANIQISYGNQPPGTPSTTIRPAGQAVCIPDVDIPPGPNYVLGLYTFRNRAQTFGAACPASVRAAQTTNNVTRYDWLALD